MTNIERKTIKLTPELAKQFLCNVYEGQRKLIPSYMRQLARDMKAERWRPETGQFHPLMLSAEGKLLEGQHRCHAVVESGKTIMTDILINVPEELFRYIDGGKPRMLSQFVNTKNANTVSALSKYANAIECGTPIASAISGRVETEDHINVRASNIELLEYIDNHIEVLENCAYEARRIYEALGNGGSKAMFANALWTISYVSNHEISRDIDKFVDEIVSDSPTHPAIAKGKSLAVKKLVEQLRNASRVKSEFWMYWLLAMYKAYGSQKKTLTLADVNAAPSYFDKLIKMM